MLQKLDLTIRKGETVAIPIRVESDTWVYKPISTIAQSAPVRITATAHGLKDGWRAAVMNAAGMTELNAANNPPKDKELRRVTVVDVDTVEFNTINAAGFKAYKSGGQLAYYAPLDLSAFTSARMKVKDRVGGTVLLDLTSPDDLELDAATQSLWLRMTAVDSAGITFKSGVFDIELVVASGAVTPICLPTSTLTAIDEITT